MTRRCAAVIAAVLALPCVARADRPASVGLGIGLAYAGTPIGAHSIGAPISLEAGTSVTGPVWWFGAATFGARALTDDHGNGNLFEVRTGPRLVRCWAAIACVGVGLDLGWSHARWTSPDEQMSTRVDGIAVSARGHAAVALASSGRVLLELSAGPTWSYPLSVAGDQTWADAGTGARGLDVGLALVVRN